MAQISGWKCDSCGIEKLPSNHWWKIFFTWSSPQTEDVEARQGADGVVILAFDKDEITEPKDFGSGYTPKKADAHICGQNCITKWMSENLLSKTR